MATIISAVAISQENSVAKADDEISRREDKNSYLSNAPARVRAERDFLKSNTQATNIQWYEVPRGFLAYYKIQGNKGRSFYDRKGRFVYNIISYNEQFLPREVRIQVKSVYYLDYKITHVNEINHNSEPGKPIYLIQITNNKLWKKLKIADGEMELLEEFAAQ